MSTNASYAAAGVDVTAGYKAVELIKAHVAKTYIPGVVSGIGGFSGLFAPDLAGLSRPVLVSGADGVGTKLRLAVWMDKHDTVGIDCVAMCVNDVAVTGARPIFFLDYVALGKNVPEKVAEIVSGVAEGCVQAGCALLGGETAEMPGFYEENEYDLAGFAVGLGDLDRMSDKEKVQTGDVLLGLPSSGVHSNGFSLIRKVFGNDGARYHTYSGELGATLGETFLTPTRIYVRPLLALAEQGLMKSAAHITGGGFFENIPRALPEGLSARIDRAAWDVPPVFRLIAREGNVPERDMFNTFNMGIGMVLVCAQEDADKAMALLKQEGESPVLLGEVAEGGEGVLL